MNLLIPLVSKTALPVYWLQVMIRKIWEKNLRESKMLKNVLRSGPFFVTRFYNPFNESIWAGGWVKGRCSKEFGKRMKQLDVDVSPPACLMNLNYTSCYINQILSEI